MRIYITIRGSMVSVAKRAAKKKKKKKKEKIEKKDHFGDFVGSNRRPPGVNQAPRAVQ